MAATTVTWTRTFNVGPGQVVRQLRCPRCGTEPRTAGGLLGNVVGINPPPPAIGVAPGSTGFIPVPAQVYGPVMMAQLECVNCKYLAESFSW